MRVLVWHVHGSYLNSLVQGSHDYLLPFLPDRGPDGLGRARTWDWPASAVEITPEQARREEIDLVVAQRQVEVDHLIEEWTGRRPGRDVATVYLEHNTPDGTPGTDRHHLAHRDDIPTVHVTHFNHLMWDSGRSPTTVVEHGVVDPGHLYTGELPHAAVVINDPVRRNRVTGTDLLARFGQVAPVDLFGMRSEPLGGSDLPQGRLHGEMARRRVYLHPNRWTSLGLSLIEAMHLGLPPVAVAATEVVEAVPPGAGVVSTDVEVLAGAVRDLVADPDAAAEMGRAARQAALSRFGLKRFLADWDRVMEEVTR